MFCYFMQVDGVSALIVQSALSKFASGGCYHAVSLENLHTIDITSYLVSQGYKMDPMDYGWSMDRVKSLATSAMQPLLNTFAALPVKETDGQVMRFSSDMPHRNGSGLAHLERMVRWMREKGFLPGPQHPVGSLPLPRGTKALADSAPAPAPVSMPKMQPIKVAETTPVPQAMQAAVSRSTPRTTAWTSRRWSSTTAALASTLLVCPSEFFFYFSSGKVMRDLREIMSDSILSHGVVVVVCAPATERRKVGASCSYPDEGPDCVNTVCRSAEGVVLRLLLGA